MDATPSYYEPTIAERVRYYVRSVWERFFPPEGNLEFHARQELQAAGLFDKDSDYGGMTAEAVMELVKVFARQGHSGYSAHQVRNIFNKVAAFEPLCPLKGTDDEWFEYAEGRFQNKRCSHVFKDEDGRAYDMDGRIFREPNGSCFTNRDSRVYITFPYTPTREYVDVPERA